MAHYAIVIVDPVLAKHTEIERHLAVHQQRSKAVDIKALRKHLAKSLGPEREAGDLHTTADVECPNDLPNCRNCGDPKHAASCRAKGHCPHCGTRHGIAPDAVLAENGLELVAVDGPPNGRAWHKAHKTFV